MRMEKNIFNVRFAISSFKFLHNLSGISAVDLDNVSSLRSWGDQRTIWVDSNSANLGIMGRNDKINGLVDN